MGLKLTIGIGDKIVIGDVAVLDVISTSAKQTTIEVTAPKDIPVNAVYRDSSKMFKNRNKEGSGDTEGNI